MPQNLTEERLTFHFNDLADVVKYDEWSYYRNQFQSPCDNKAIDFLLIEDRTLWLIEVKDYRGRTRTKPSDLADEVALKVRDTLAGIVAASLRANDPVEQAFSRNALKQRTVRVALHLEQSPGTSKLYPQAVNPASLKMKLKQKARWLDPHPVIVSRSTLNRSIPWTVTSH